MDMIISVAFPAASASINERRRERNRKRGEREKKTEREEREKNRKRGEREKNRKRGDWTILFAHIAS